MLALSKLFHLGLEKRNSQEKLKQTFKLKSSRLRQELVKDRKLLFLHQAILEALVFSFG